MAKIKTSEHEEQLSVIAKLLIETDKNVKELKKAQDKISENKELYELYFENAIKSTVNKIDSLTSLKIREINQISDNISQSHTEAIQQIKNSAYETIKDIREMSEKKIKSAKQTYWFTGIIAVVLGIATIMIEVNRSVDEKMITEAVRAKAEVEAWKLDLKEWMRDNPKDAKSFIDWTKRKGNK